MRARLLSLSLSLLVAACGPDDGTSPVEPTPAPTVGRSVGVPEGWLRGGNGAYFVGLDSLQRRSGAAAAYVSAAAEEPTGFVTLTQLVHPEAWRGRRVRWSGWVRYSDLAGGGGSLWIRVDGAGAMLAFDNMSDRPLLGSSDWREVSLVVDVPDDALGISLGFLLSGPGELLVDDVRLEAASDDVPTTGLLPDRMPVGTDSATSVAAYARALPAPVNRGFEGLAGPPAATVAWLSRTAVPIATTVPVSDDSDLEPFRGMVGSARVVGLGEGTHGTREFFELKDRLVRFLVREMGFTRFAIEASALESAELNRYVMEGVGDPERLLANLYFWTWNTREVLDLVQWMREWNLSAPPDRRVAFQGFDMQYPGSALDTVTSFVARRDPPSLRFVEERLACLAPFRNHGRSFARSPSAYAALPSGAQAACRQGLREVHERIAAGREAYLAASSPAEYEDALHAVRLVLQFEEVAALSVSRRAAAEARDRFMAENALRLVERAPPDGRTVLWAHNDHLARVPGAMGDWLARSLGREYVNLGFLFGTGSFNAVDPLREVQAMRAAPAPAHALEAVFARTGEARLLFDAREIPVGGADAAPMAGPILMRSIGAEFDPAFEERYFEPRRFPRDFDLLMWVEESSPTRLLPFPD